VLDYQITYILNIEKHKGDASLENYKLLNSIWCYSRHIWKLFLSISVRKILMQVNVCLSENKGFEYL